MTFIDNEILKSIYSGYKHFYYNIYVSLCKL